jgi:hypothetical protein
MNDIGLLLLGNVNNELLKYNITYNRVISSSIDGDRDSGPIRPIVGIPTPVFEEKYADGLE